MIVRYTENLNCYVFTNFAVSNNPVFLSDGEVENFKKRLDKHLSPICEILAYQFKSDHYQIVVALKDREAFVKFYSLKHKLPEDSKVEIPISSYILSQEMANIQSGYAKWFNSRHNRFGGVFGRRYTKVLIQNQDELEHWVNKLNKGEDFWTFSEFWSFLKNFIQRSKSLVSISVTSISEYESNLQGRIGFNKIGLFLRLESFLLRGQYKPKIPNHQNKLWKPDF